MIGIINFSSLDGVSIHELTEVFNASFADYFVPVHKSEEDMRTKIKTEGIDLKLSVGAFEDGKLVAFILHGSGELEGAKTLYNAGTGVVPDHRGMKLTSRMYDHLLPLVREHGFRQSTLEVITNNHPAISAYKQVGFKIIREFDCLRGRVEKEINCSFNITPLERYEWALLSSFWDWNPSWQHNINAVIRSVDNIKAIQIQQEQLTVAYAIYHPSGRIHQFAVHPIHRRRGMAHALFKDIQSQLEAELLAVNIDMEDEGSIQFLKSIGLRSILQQHEMRLVL